MKEKYKIKSKNRSVEKEILKLLKPILEADYDKHCRIVFKKVFDNMKKV